MNTPILMVFVSIVAFSQIGCGDKKKEKEIKAMAAACYSTPECVMKLQNPAMAQQMAMAATKAKAEGGTGQVAPDGKGGFIPVLPQSVIDQKRQQVLAALDADKNNPRSPNYDPSRAPASTTTVATGGLAPASVGGASPASVAGGGGGDIMR